MINAQDASESKERENIKRGVTLARDEIWNNLVQISHATHLSDMKQEKREEMNALIRNNVDNIITTLTDLCRSEVREIPALERDTRHGPQ